MRLWPFPRKPPGSPASSVSNPGGAEGPDPRRRGDRLPLRRLPLLVLALLLAGGGRVSLGADAPSPPAPSGETVVLLHGIANVPLSMAYLEKSLRDAGYQVLNLGYPSTRLTVEEAAAEVRERVRALGSQAAVHFVAHSLGNIVVRKMLAEPLPGLGRIVMITPPNHGSLVAAELRDLGLFRWVFGPAGQELSSGNRDFFEALPVPSAPFGIIAGGRGDQEGYNPLIPGDDDGTISVETTRLEGAADTILLKGTHTLLLFSRETARQTLFFLREGRFLHGGDPGSP